MAAARAWRFSVGCARGKGGRKEERLPGGRGAVEGDPRGRPGRGRRGRGARGGGRRRGPGGPPGAAAGPCSRRGAHVCGVLWGFSAPGVRVAARPPPPPAARSPPAPAPGVVSSRRVRRRDKAPPRARPPPISASAIMGQMIHFNLAISPEGTGTGGWALGLPGDGAVETAEWPRWVQPQAAGDSRSPQTTRRGSPPSRCSSSRFGRSLAS